MNEPIEDLCRRWSDVLVELERARGSDDVPESVLSPGASEDEIADAEARLGVRLPPSYREFLRVTNGARAIVGWPGLWPAGHATGGRMLPASGLRWLRDGEPELVRLWDDMERGWDQQELDAGVTPDELAAQEAAGRSYGIVGGGRLHLGELLQVSEFGDGQWVLLDPHRGAGGEWEAIHFANWYPGGVIYRSFAELLAAAVSAARDSLRDVIETEDDPERVRAAVAHLEGTDAGPAAPDRGSAEGVLVGLKQPERWVPELAALARVPADHTAMIATFVLARVRTPESLEALLALAAGFAPGAARFGGYRGVDILVSRLREESDPQAADAVRRLTGPLDPSPPVTLRFFLQPDADPRAAGPDAP